MKFFFILFLFLVFASCTKEIQLKTPKVDSEIVVDGYIEQGQFPVVYLTQSFPFCSTIDSASLFQQIVSEAKVSVSDGEKIEILTLKLDTSFYPPLYYKGNEIIGEVGKQYNLKVEIRGKVITATTSILPIPYLNSLAFHLEEGMDTLGYLLTDFSDNPNEKNFYRIYTKIKNKEKKFLTTYYNTFDDQYFNGQTFHFVLYHTYSYISTTHFAQKYYKLGDTIDVKFCSIDKASFDFWNTYQGKVLNITSFASSPNKIKSNINGGLGIWAGYGASYYQIIAK